MTHSRLAVIALLILAGAVSAGATPLFIEDFSDNSAGWVLGTTWQIGPTSVGPAGTGNPDPANDHTPTADNGVAGVVLGGNAPTNLHDFYWLTSPVIDTSSAVGPVTMEFHRWLNSDYTPYMQNKVEVWSGSAWVSLWASGGSPPIFDNDWTLQSFDVTAYQNSGFRARFGYSITSVGVYTVSSWNVDDFAVSDASDPVPEPGTLALIGSGFAALFARRRSRG